MLLKVLGSGVAFVERNAQEVPQAEAVRAPPGDAALAVDAFEVAHQQHPKIDARRDRRLAAFFLLCVIAAGTASRSSDRSRLRPAAR